MAALTQSLLHEGYHICDSDALNNHHAILTILMSIGFVVSSTPQVCCPGVVFYLSGCK